MAGKSETKMARDAKKMSDEEKAARNYMANDAEWEAAQGEEFGGQADILQLEVGEIAGPLKYVGQQEMTTDLGDTTVHMATNADGETLRLPIQATFQRAIDQAGMARGDVFYVKRFDDQIKKKGKGAGNPMAIYGVKVKERAPRQAAAA